MFVLKDSAERQKVLDLVRSQRPRLLIISWPCEYWGKLTDANFRSKQERRRLMQKREQERPLLQFTEELFDIQIGHGDDALAENPLASYAFKEAPIQRILRHPDVSVGVSHGCQFNLRSSQTGLLLKKPTLWISTSVEICDALSKRCPTRPGHVAHEHGVCQGHSVTSHAGRYTKEMAQAIHAGFVKTLRRKDPSHVVKILKKLWKIAGKGEQDRFFHWTDDRLVKAVDRYQKCCKGSGSYVYVNDHGDTAVYEPGETLAKGVSFEVPEGRQLDDGARAVLRKLHSNLGHPSALDLKRFMRSAGAPQELVEAIGWLRCAACAKTQRARSHRVA